MKNTEAYNKLFRDTMSYLVSQSIYTVARLNIADYLSKGPMSIEELAEKSGSDKDYLYRIMRLLSNQEIFVLNEDDTFSINDSSHFLQSDVPHSFRDFAILINAVPCPFPAISKLYDCTLSGKIPFDEFYGQPVFDHVAENPELALLLDSAMLSAHTMGSDSFLENYDLSGFKNFADVGGGSGEATTRVLREYPEMTATIFDLPHVIERTREHFKNNGLIDRCKLVPGSFFEDVPVESDLYFMRQVLHDWTDEQCITILKNLRRNTATGSKLLISDCVIKEQPIKENTPYYDMLMLYITGGKERTVEEFKYILEESGYKLTNVIDTGFWFGVVEAEAV